MSQNNACGTRVQNYEVENEYQCILNPCGWWIKKTKNHNQINWMKIESIQLSNWCTCKVWLNWSCDTTNTCSKDGTVHERLSMGSKHALTLQTNHDHFPDLVSRPRDRGRCYRLQVLDQDDWKEPAERMQLPRFSTSSTNCSDKGRRDPGCWTRIEWILTWPRRCEWTSLRQGDTESRAVRFIREVISKLPNCN